jgi:hypothetical protein
MLIVSGAFAICIVLMFAFVYWQMASDLTTSVDDLILAHTIVRTRIKRTAAKMSRNICGKIRAA